MALAARQLTQEAYEAPSTRVYAGGYAEPARKPAQNRPKPRMPSPEPQKPSPRTRVHKHSARSIKPAVKINLGQRLLALTSICLVASALLFVLVRYAQIAEQYSEINRLKSEIQESTLNIAALNVQLQMAVNLEDARRVALEAGMGYPQADQIIRPGSVGTVIEAGPQNGSDSGDTETTGGETDQAYDLSGMG